MPGGDTAQSSDATGDAQHAPYRALAVTTGKYHSCALLDDYTVKCWGENSFGQLGLGDRRPRGISSEEMGDALPLVNLGAGRTATAITAGRYATCAILDNQTLKCWGWGSQLGLGGLDGNLGDDAGEMGDNLPTVDLGPGRFPKAVAVGTNESCVLLDDDSVRCWVNGSKPQSIPLPAGARPVEVIECSGICALLADGRVLRPVSSSVPDAIPQAIDLGEGAIARAVAGWEMGGCALLQGGGHSCWGSMKIPPFAFDLIAVSLGFSVSCGIEADRSVTCWSGPGYAIRWWEGVSPGSVRLGQPAIAIAKGADVHTCALLADGTIKCWGSNTAGALGGGNPTTTDWPPVDLGTRPRGRD